MEHYIQESRHTQALASNVVDLLFISDVGKMIRKYNQIGFVAHYL